MLVKENVNGKNFNVKEKKNQKKCGGCPFKGGRRREHCQQQQMPNFFQQFMGDQQQGQQGFDFSQLGNLAQTFMTPQNMGMAQNLFKQFTEGEKNTRKSTNF